MLKARHRHPRHDAVVPVLLVRFVVYAAAVVVAVVAMWRTDSYWVDSVAALLLLTLTGLVMIELWRELREEEPRAHDGAP